MIGGKNMLTEQELFDLFAKQHNWQDRYRQLIGLSKQLALFPDEEKTERNQVHGCENRVWLTYQKQPDNKFIFAGDSEGRIVKGLLAILLVLANDKTKDDIDQIDFQAQLKTLKITDELSETRLLGLTKLIEKIKNVS